MLFSENGMNLLAEGREGNDWNSVLIESAVQNGLHGSENIRSNPSHCQGSVASSVQTIGSCSSTAALSVPSQWLNCAVIPLLQKSWALLPYIWTEVGYESNNTG